MARNVAMVTIVVPEYAAGRAFYEGILGFDCLVDQDLGQGKRWVVVAPGTSGARLLLAKASVPRQAARIGDQTGGRVAFFLETDDFANDYANLVRAGVHFEEAARSESYGRLAVFRDPFGNRWDLIEPARLDTARGAG